jgi:hypothetical protein
LLLDADIELTPGIIAQLFRKARDERLALVSLMAEPPMKNAHRAVIDASIYLFL